VYVEEDVSARLAVLTMKTGRIELMAPSRNKSCRMLYTKAYTIRDTIPSIEEMSRENRLTMRPTGTSLYQDKDTPIIAWTNSRCSLLAASQPPN
jgi:hypothetical protein